MSQREATMEKKVSLGWLLSFYGELLTQNQREIARLYLEEDFSLAEIAQQFCVSRQSVHDTISRTSAQLSAFEEKLGLLRRFSEMEKGLKACGAALERVKPTDETQDAFNEAKSIMIELLRMEEQ